MARNLAPDAATAGRVQSVPVLHVRFAGRSYDVPLAELDIGRSSSDHQVQQALANHLEIAASRLDATVIDRHPNGNLTLRPEAVFG